MFGIEKDPYTWLMLVIGVAIAGSHILQPSSWWFGFGFALIVSHGGKLLFLKALNKSPEEAEKNTD